MQRLVNRRTALSRMAVLPFVTSQASLAGTPPSTLPKLGALFSPGRLPKPILPGVVAQRPPHARDFPAPLAARDLTDGASGWSALGNNDVGDCVLACAAHLVQLAAWHATKTWIPVLDQEVVNAYYALTGWNPTSTVKDPGMFVNVGFDYAMRTGFSGHKLGGYYRSIYAPGDLRYGLDVHSMKRAGIERLLSGFGGAAVAIDLPVNAHNKPLGPWVEADVAGGSAGGHCIPIVAYDPAWLYCVTWGRIVKMDWAFLTATSREFYFAYAEDWMTPSGSADLHYSRAEMADTLAYYEVGEYLQFMHG